ncbi:unnamed protein product [Acanthoscelides obtectus]|uniref:Uncharacterized protein n=1 Tax=Acanthoscelides obtectus TaxID=200917 RepID=A0A9P0KWU7_ACAOB|nr:unnamed protein product [Acanthoscelides obtectus]CAK1658287.1 hypothetical protein AOBTE_LOCUS20813 [Acanthoscelides obtectus]
MGAHERYELTLWYYHLFHFLGHQETPRKSVSNLNETEEEVEAQPTENSIESLDQPIEEDESTTHDDTGCQTTEATQSTPKKSTISRPPKRKIDKCDSVLDAIEGHFKKP